MESEVKNLENRTIELLKIVDSAIPFSWKNELKEDNNKYFLEVKRKYIFSLLGFSANMNLFWADSKFQIYPIESYTGVLTGISLLYGKSNNFNLRMAEKFSKIFKKINDGLYEIKINSFDDLCRAP